MPMLEEAIVNLLLRHNCVVVPAFGGFVAQSTGAIIDMNSGIITPPRKSVLFNKQLINNDGLLISHISKESEMDYVDAEQFLADKVEEWQTQLKDGQRVSIDKIGHLFLDAERNISFEQDRYFNLLLQSYGLNKVHFISEEEVAPVAIAPVENKEVTPIIPIVVPPASEEAEEVKVVAVAEPVGNKKLWKYIAAAVLLPFAFFTYWIPVETNVLESGMISIKDFNPTYQSGDGIYQKSNFGFSTKTELKQATTEEMIANLPEGINHFIYKFDEDLNIPVRIERTSDKLVPEIQKTAPKEVEIAKPTEKEEAKPVVSELKPVNVNTKQIHYVTGCFSDKANAESMVKTMKERGLNAVILDEKNEMTRVSAGGVSNQADFERLVKKAQQIGYKGWKLD